MLLSFSFLSCTTFIKRKDTLYGAPFCQSPYKVHFLNEGKIFNKDKLIGSCKDNRCVLTGIWAHYGIAQQIERAFVIANQNEKVRRCFVDAPKDKADFIINNNFETQAHLSVPWMTLSAATFGIVPYWSSESKKSKLKVYSTKKNLSKEINLETDASIWISFFLLPVMPFHSNQDAVETLKNNFWSRALEQIRYLEM